jgi:hypothetical protein
VRTAIDGKFSSLITQLKAKQLPHTIRNISDRSASWIIPPNFHFRNTTTRANPAVSKTTLPSIYTFGSSSTHLSSKMLSHLRWASSSSKCSTARFSPFKVADAARTFQSFVQRQGQSALAEAPSYEHAPVFETSEELTRSQFPTTEAPSAQPATTSKALNPDVYKIATQKNVVPLYYRGSKFDKEPYWQKIDRWKDVTQEQFLSHRWNVS